MPNADQIRESLEVRIAHLERELRTLRAAHAALTAGAPGPSTEGARTGTRRGRGEGMLSSVLRVFNDWDARGRPPQAATAWQRQRWLAAAPTQARLLEALPDRLDRSTVRKLVLAKPLTATGMFEAIVIVYAWGWSTTSSA